MFVININSKLRRISLLINFFLQLNELHSECEKSHQNQEKMASEFEKQMNTHLEAHTARTVACLDNANALRSNVDSKAEVRGIFSVVMPVLSHCTIC